MLPYCRLLLAMVLIVDRVCCEARVHVLKVWFGCAVPENASVVDEYSSGGLERTTAKNENKIPLCVPNLDL